MKKLLAVLTVAAGAIWGQAGGRGPAPVGRGAQPQAGATTPGRGAPGSGIKDLKYPPLHSVQAAPLVTATLPNGMRLFLQENHELPVIGGLVMVRTGNVFDPAERIGLATLAGGLLRTGGTALKTGEEVDSQLQLLGATLESAIGETAGVVGFTALKSSSAGALRNTGGEPWLMALMGSAIAGSALLLRRRLS